MTTRLTTIAGTGDPGAARGALDAAAELDLKIGGHTAVTDLPAAIAEHLRRTLAPRMAARLNVQDSDGTLIVSFSTSLREGSPAAYADEAVEQQRKPSLHIVLPAGGHPEDVRREVLAFVAEEKIATLHVTGPREAEEPGIQRAVHDALVWIFEDEVKQSAAVLIFAGAVQTAAEIAEADGNARARAMFAGVDRTAAPESLREALDEERAAFERAAERHEEFRGTVVETIARIAADLPNRPERPPLTTQDALRQVERMARGSPPIKPDVLEPQHWPEERGRSYHNYMPPPPVPSEVVAARDQLLAAHGPASLGVSQDMLGGDRRRAVAPPALGQPWTRDNWLWCGCAGPHGRCPNERCTNHKDSPWP